MFQPTSLLPALSLLASAQLSIELGLVQFKGRRGVVAYVLSFLVFGILDIAISTMAGFATVFKLYPALVILPSLVICWVFHRLEGVRFVVTYCYVLVFAHAVTIAGVAVVQILNVENFAAPLFAALVATIVLILVKLLLGRDYKTTVEQVEGGWGGMMVFVGAVALGILAIFTMGNFFDSKVMLPINIALILMATVVLLLQVSFYHYVRELLDQQHNLQLSRLQSLATEKLDEEKRKAAEEERRRRHDQRHMVQVIIDEVNGGNTAAALEHLEKMRGGAEVPDMAYCREPAVNSIIKLWVARAEEQGIDVTVRADVPESLAADPMELATLFANLMENAYEGCMRLEKNEAKRFIDMVCTYKGGKLVCRIKNACRTDIVFDEGMPSTQKRGGGIGTHSAKATVEKYGGMISYSVEDGVFTTRFMMPI